MSSGISQGPSRTKHLPERKLAGPPGVLTPGARNGQKGLPRLGRSYPHILSATTVTTPGNFEGALTFCLPREPQKPTPPPTQPPDPPGQAARWGGPTHLRFSRPGARLPLTWQVCLTCLWGTTPPHSWPITDSPASRPNSLP